MSKGKNARKRLARQVEEITGQASSYARAAFEAYRYGNARGLEFASNLQGREKAELIREVTNSKRTILN
jgi:hypothetical protein